MPMGSIGPIAPALDLLSPDSNMTSPPPPKPAQPRVEAARAGLLAAEGHEAMSSIAPSLPQWMS
jgi:hypothetical protein